MTRVMLVRPTVMPSNVCLAKKYPIASSKLRRKGCSSACSEDDDESFRLLQPQEEAGFRGLRGQGTPADHRCPRTRAAQPARLPAATAAGDHRCDQQVRAD